MPLLDSSFLPPTIFILTHILGIAGVLYWKRCARGRAGNQPADAVPKSAVGCEGGREREVLKGPVRSSAGLPVRPDCVGTLRELALGSPRGGDAPAP